MTLPQVGQLVPLGDRRLHLTERYSQGRTSAVFRAIDQSGHDVVLKVAIDVPAAIDRERRVLQALAATGYPAPRPAGHGTLGAERRECLLLDHVPGSRPTTVDGYRRLGRRLAELGQARVEARSLSRFTVVPLVWRHRAALDALWPVFGLPLTRYLAAIRLPRTEIRLIHGDPSPDNFLDDPSGGWLIDFGSAAWGPSALDLGRACAVTALEMSGEQRAEATRALVEGYADRAGCPPPDLHPWSVVAATQIAHWRLRNRGRAGVPPVGPVAALLRTAATEGLPWC